jgi:phosphonate transport system substrate-binding protein
MMKMQTWAVNPGIILIIIFGLVWAAPAAADNDPWLRFAVFPYTDSRTLIEHQLPFKAFLEKTLQRPLIMLTAPDFRTFMQRTLAGDYDLTECAAYGALCRGAGSLSAYRHGYTPRPRRDRGARR